MVNSFMMRLNARLYLVLLFSLFLMACSPHSGTGVWKAVDDNVQGIVKIRVGFDGKAEFITTKLENATWHCFWTMAGDNSLSFDCTPSTNVEQKKAFTFAVNDHGVAELTSGVLRLGTFTRTQENPSPRE
jgi:hypothetical protein